MRSGELITADESHAARRGREDEEREREREKGRARLHHCRFSDLFIPLFILRVYNESEE